ncbi:cbb3-type cytochrome c oxidase N-terminal domain-containing protein [Ferruginibacter sp. SUN106]|uniref:cbb3-type cytochrome c oxidase N-terminal domain-containing protein n=1 Tax=Ferruginibacter sp. SUN106 TaxID=2978348 RepID=UPI003D36BB82
MHFIYLIKKKIILAIAALFVVSVAMAQTTTPAAPTTVTSGYNQLATLLVIMTIVLAFVLWGLGQVLVVLSRQLMEKQKNATKVISAIIVLVLLFASQSAAAQDAAKDAVTVVPNYGGLSATSFYLFVTVIITEVIAIVFLAFSIRRIYSELLPQKEATAVKKSAVKEWWARMDKKIFTKAIPVEKEADILLDHNYDGIRELDNALPPWWKYGFYFTIVVAFIYIFNFHVFGNGKNPTEEYAAEMENARIEKEIYESTNKDKIDENNVPMADATGLARAKEIFETKCWACHGKLGEGGAGPNLTDDYWLHKGSLNDIFHTIKNGYADKGMQSWATDYTPKEISFLASYVKTLHGTNPPNPKAAQGELYTETAATPAADSTKKTTTDTTNTKKVTVVNKTDTVKTVSKK